ncbi:MAG: hypothetical protein Q9228_004837, partial [Teloschistes exilis]
MPHPPPSGIHKIRLQAEEADEEIGYVSQQEEKSHQRPHVLGQVSRLDVLEALMFQDAYEDASVEEIVGRHAGTFEKAEEFGYGLGWVGRMDSGLHGVNAIERFVCHVFEMVIVSPAGGDYVLHPFSLNSLLGPANVVLGDVDCLDLEALMSHVESYMASTTARIKDHGA